MQLRCSCRCGIATDLGRKAGEHASNPSAGEPNSNHNQRDHKCYCDGIFNEGATASVTPDMAQHWQTTQRAQPCHPPAPLRNSSKASPDALRPRNMDYALAALGMPMLFELQFGTKRASSHNAHLGEGSVAYRAL